MKVHLDTDLGGDTDDLCALAMLLRWPEVELTGVTTVTDVGGQRAGLAAYAMALGGAGETPVAAGAAGSLGGFRTLPGYPDLATYWREEIRPLPAAPGAVLELLARSIEAGAVVVGIGPWTNLALLEVFHPGLLRSTTLVLMGGTVRPPADGFPSWGPEMDYNVQQDTLAARLVWERCAPVMAPVDVTLRVALRDAHLPRLRDGDALARLLAHQGELHGEHAAMRRTGREHAALPDDLLNFQYDPLACAVAIGWDGATVEELRLEARVDGDGTLSFPETPTGTATRVVTGVDGEGFERHWLDIVAPAGE